MNSKIFVIVAILLIATLAFGQEQFINTNNADKPFHDEKDVARIEVCEMF
jgi:hypothetical protein